MKTTGCVLDWRGGTRDWSRYHHALTEHNTIPVRGVNDEARDFNGVDAYIDWGNHASLNIANAITVSAWIKTSNDTTAQDIIYKKSSVGGYWLYFRTNSPYLRFRLVSSGDHDCNVTTKYQDGERHHITGTFNGSVIKVYVDGIEKGSINWTGTIGNSLPIPLHIGGPVLYYTGTIDEVNIYNHALTPLEIWNNYVTMKPYVPLSESPVAIV